jgi:hypothetical protein
MKDVGLFYRHLFAFTVVCYILWTFGIVRGNLAYFYQFGYFVPRKNLATLHTRAQKRFKVKFGIQLIVMFVGKNQTVCSVELSYVKIYTCIKVGYMEPIHSQR